MQPIALIDNRGTAQKWPVLRFHPLGSTNYRQTSTTAPTTPGANPGYPRDHGREEVAVVASTVALTVPVAHAPAAPQSVRRQQAV